jgi:hypothetical protein
VCHFCSVLWIYLKLIAKLFDVVYEENSFALTTLSRLDDHDLVKTIPCFFLGHVTLQLGYLLRNYPGLWIKTKVDGVLIFHLFEALSEVMLFRYSAHCREVVYFLEGFDLTEFLRRNRNVVPDDVHVRMSV